MADPGVKRAIEELQELQWVIPVDVSEILGKPGVTRYAAEIASSTTKGVARLIAERIEELKAELELKESGNV